MDIDNPTLSHLMLPLEGYLQGDITELVINRPNQVFTEAGGEWAQHEAPALDIEWILHFSQVVATQSCQDIGDRNPLLSTRLPNGMRIQIVLPPAVSSGRAAIAIRKPSASTITWERVRDQGMLSHIKSSRIKKAFTEQEEILLHLQREENYEEFLKKAVKYKKNIIISGATGTGKTTFTNLLVTEIPLNERIGTIEDARELVVPHANRVHMIYSEGGQGIAEVTADSLLKACMRLRFDRILLSEIRGGEAFAYINSLYSGHPGSITSMHTGSTAEAFTRLVMYFKQSPVGGKFDTVDVEAMIYSQIDVVMQFEAVDGQRRVKELHYDPLMKKAMLGKAESIRREYKELLKREGYDISVYGMA